MSNNYETGAAIGHALTNAINIELDKHRGEEFNMARARKYALEILAYSQEMKNKGLDNLLEEYLTERSSERNKTAKR